MWVKVLKNTLDSLFHFRKPILYGKAILHHYTRNFVLIWFKVLRLLYHPPPPPLLPELAVVGPFPMAVLNNCPRKPYRANMVAPMIATVNQFTAFQRK
jgi:hypothetical protein